MSLEKAELTFWDKYGEGILQVLQSITVILIGFLGGGILMYLWGYDPVNAYKSMFIGNERYGMQGAFGGPLGWSTTLREFMFLLPSGLALGICFLGGIFNIGVEGALYLGAFSSFVVGYLLPMPGGLVGRILHPLLCMIVGAAVGGAWLFIPAILKVKRGAHEVVTTIMLNYIATFTTEMLVVTAFLPKTGIVPGGILTPPVRDTAMVPPLPFAGGKEVTSGVIISLLIFGVIYYLMRGTTLGYMIKCVGSNPKAAEYGGIDVDKVTIILMVLSGVIGGLVGVLDVVFTEYRFNQAFSPGYGFTGIPIALIGRLNPVGILLASFFIAALHVGARSLQPATGMPKEVSLAIEGMIVMFAALPGLFDMIRAYIRRRRAEEKEEVK